MEAGVERQDQLARRRDQQRERRRTRSPEKLAREREAARQWRAANSAKRVEAAARWNAANPERRLAAHRRYHLKRYGITPHEFEMLRHAQDFKCAICGAEGSGRKGSPFPAVDHDHSSGRVRGLLCGPCNVGLGQFQDDPTLLLKAADYLLKDNLKNHG